MVRLLGFMCAEPRPALDDPCGSLPTEAIPSFPLPLSPHTELPGPEDGARAALPPSAGPRPSRQPLGPERVFNTITDIPSKYKTAYHFSSADSPLPATGVTSRAVLPQNCSLRGKPLPRAVAAGDRGVREGARRRLYLEPEICIWLYLEVQVWPV